MDEELKKLVEENLQVTQEILKTVKYIKSYVVWTRVLGFLKLLVIIIPLILGYIYLIPVLRDTYGRYIELLETSKSAKEAGGNISIDSLKGQLEGLMKKN